jgi:hypothetical protein
MLAWIRIAIAPMCGNFRVVRFFSRHHAPGQYRLKYNVPAKELIKDFTAFGRGEPLVSDAHRMLVCATPKSGSMFLHRIFVNLPNFNNCNLNVVNGSQERELCVRKLVMSHRGFDNYSTHVHLRYSHVTGNLIKQFNLKPIVLTRDIFDSVVSIRDFYFNQQSKLTDTGHDIAYQSPHAYLPEDLFNWDDEKIYNFIIDMAIPWHFNFLMCWQNYKHGFWLNYVDLVADPAGTVRAISDFYQMGLSDEDIDAAVNAANDNPGAIHLNKGVSGRGDSLPDELRERIYKMADYYKGYDLSPFGL